MCFVLSWAPESLAECPRRCPSRGKRLHTRNRHLRNHRGFQWHLPLDVQQYFPTEFHLSVVLPKGLSLFQWISLELSNGLQWHFPMDFHFCDLWCEIFCPDPRPARMIIIIIIIIISYYVICLIVYYLIYHIGLHYMLLSPI